MAPMSRRLPEATRPLRVDAVGDSVQILKAFAQIALDVCARLPRTRRAGWKLVRAARAPGLDQFARHIDMALESDVQLTDHVGLVWIERVGEHPRCVPGKIEDVVVPLKRRKARPAPEPAGSRRVAFDFDV